jgi:hypothetical protein
MARAARAAVADAYARAKSAGRWDGRYASKDVAEWFAEVTKYYFRPGEAALAVYDAELAHGHAWLAEYDPIAYAFADDVYSGRFDPGATARVPVALRSGHEESTLKSAGSERQVNVLVRNRTKRRVRATWLGFDGERDRREGIASTAAPGGEVELYTFTGHAFVVLDEAGSALCTFVAGEEDGVVELRGGCP